jgi:hypothetical protein
MRAQPYFRSVALSFALLAVAPAAGEAQRRGGGGMPVAPRSAPLVGRPRLTGPVSTLPSRPGVGPRTGWGRPGGSLPGSWGGPGVSPFGYGYGVDYGPGYGPSGWTGGWTGGVARRRLRPITPAVIVVGPWLGGSYYGTTSSAAYVGGDALAVPEDGGEPRPPRTKVIDAAPAPVAHATSIVAEPLDGGALLRLRWTGAAPIAGPVTLVVADSARRVLAAQQVREAPFTAVFDRAGRVAYVGVTAERPDGVTTTTLVPLGIATAQPR